MSSYMSIPGIFRSVIQGITFPLSKISAPGAGGGRRGRGRVVECATRRRGSAALSRRRHCALRRGAGLASSDGRGGETRGECRAGRHCRSSSGRGRAASQQPAARGGWAAEWGGVSGNREWLPRRPGGSPPSASPTPAGSPPRPLVRPRGLLGRLGRPGRPLPAGAPAFPAP